jgi:hypothetical protein
MRKPTPGEILSISTLLHMETNALAVAKAGVGTIQDQQLRDLTQAGITATEARIAGLQQFVAENHLADLEVHS